MIPTIFWIAVIVLMIIVEASTVGLISVWFAGGALCALIASLCGGSIWLQLILFLAVSCVLLACLWPLRNRLLKRKIQPTNADRVIGMTAVITEAVDNIAASGAVQVDGKIWSARSTDNSVLTVGELVLVDRIEGVKLYVSRIPVTAE